MAVQAVFFDEISCVKRLRYVFAEGETLLLALDCEASNDSSRVLTFEDLRQEIRSLCRWQQDQSVMVGFRESVVDILTIYHAFEHALHQGDTLMLISTPPAEYFDAQAA